MVAGWGAQCLVPLLACRIWALRGSKICIFLRYTHITPIFWAQAGPTERNTSPPYPEPTLDAFGFRVGAHLTDRGAVLRHRMAKNAVFGPKSIFLLTRTAQ